MITLVYIALLGMFSYHCMAIEKGFRGSSSMAKEITSIAGIIGYTAYYITLIWSFWHFTWWVPIATFIVGIVFGRLTAIFFQKNIVGMMLSPVLVLVFAVLSICSLL